MADKLKICAHCNTQKDCSEFHKQKKMKSGLSSWCKQCKKELSNTPESKQYKQEYSKTHRDNINKNSSTYYYRHTERVREAQKRSDLKHIDRFKTHAKEYKIKYRSRQYQLDRERMKTDLCFKLKTNLRKRLYSALKHNQKSGSAVRDLGCAIPELKQWLESQFQPGMTWDNYGNGLNKWSIDHIIPLSKIDLTDRQQFLKANHWFNLQPLWSNENASKNDKMEIS